MKKLQLHSIEPRSFLRLSVYFAFPLGLWFGIFALLLSLLGGRDVSIVTSWGTYSGLTGGLIALICAPLLAPVGALLYAFLGHWPFEWFLRLTNGVTVEGDWEAEV
jgi:hypothetical protein